jgi:hypothetical protein
MMMFVDVDVGFVVNTNVATESHPTLFVVVYVYVPGAVLTIAFQVYDGVFTHTATLVVLVDVGLVVNTNVATESHPTLFVEVYVYVPGAVLLIPFQV